MATDRYTDLLRQGFMKPRKAKRTYSVGTDARGYVNTGITSKAEALKVAAAYVRTQYEPDLGQAYVWVKDDATGGTVAAWQLQVHKWARVA